MSVIEIGDAVTDISAELLRIDLSDPVDPCRELGQFTDSDPVREFTRIYPGMCSEAVGRLAIEKATLGHLKTPEQQYIFGAESVSVSFEKGVDIFNAPVQENTRTRRLLNLGKRALGFIVSPSDEFELPKYVMSEWDKVFCSTRLEFPKMGPEELAIAVGETLARTLPKYLTKN